MWRGLLPPLLPQEIHLFSSMCRKENKRFGASLCPFQQIHHHLSMGDTTTISHMGSHMHLQLYINMNTKGWDLLDQLLTMTSLGRAELVKCSHMWPLARLLVLGPIILNPHALAAASTSLPLDFGQEIFWSLLIKPSEGSRTSLSWTSTSTGMTLQSLLPWFTISLSQSETILSPKDVVLPTPCPGCMFLLVPWCQHDLWCSYQLVGSVWWITSQPD